MERSRQNWAKLESYQELYDSKPAPSILTKIEDIVRITIRVKDLRIF
jgi:hypothetical protein